MKKAICISLLAASLIFMGASPKPITVSVNGIKINTAVPPVIENGRTLVPAADIAAALGAKVEWIAEEKTVTALYKSKILLIQIGSSTIYESDLISGESKSYSIDVPAQIIEGKTFVPVRAVAESFGLNVEWEQEESNVKITG